MSTPNDTPEHLNAYLRAEEAGAHGDIKAAEGWTNLMERQCAVLERTVEALIGAGYDVVSVLKSTDRLPNRAARRASRKRLQNE